jgi:hypothetical protein
MRRILWLAIAALVVTAITYSTASAQYGGGGGMGGSKRKILSFSSMYGVNGPFVGATNAIRGVEGDSLPWVVKSAKGTLTSGGKLTVSVKGVVFAAAVGVPPELQGINDEPEFRAIVSCLAVNGAAVEESNVITQGFPANAKGNAKIKAQVTLPQPCVAPIVFIVGADEELWFAATGF